MNSDRGAENWNDDDRHDRSDGPVDGNFFQEFDYVTRQEARNQCAEESGADVSGDVSADHAGNQPRFVRHTIGDKTGEDRESEFESCVTNVQDEFERR